jgi:triosephosphate isomerase (TIM)
MAERRTLVAGNWKMNGLQGEAAALARDLITAAADGHAGCEVLVCPPATAIATVGRIVADSGIALGGQDCHAAAKGAFTGDISAEMLKDLGCRYVILGHSERRHGHGETDDEISAKVAAAWRAGLAAILCIGETRKQREEGMALAVVEAQLAGSLPPGASADRLVVAYEPVWAIGTGLTASLADIAEIHGGIRAAVPAGTRILYGGSVNPGNAAGILALDDVDGGLIGGASLKAVDFWAIVHAATSPA